MTKILSQDEIDALLNSVASPDLEKETNNHIANKAGSVNKYDFKHPNRVSKDQIKTLENMHDNFAGHYASTLSSMMQTVVDVDLVAVDQITYSEFITLLSTPSCTYTFSAAPMEGLSLVDFNPALAFSFIDRMFGGMGNKLEHERELTGIERSIMNRLVIRLFEDLEGSWRNIHNISINREKFESNPQFIQIVPQGETVIAVSFRIKLFHSTGTMTVCYPYVALESVISRLSAQNWIDATKKKNKQIDRDAIFSKLQDVTTEITAELIETEISVRNFVSLKINDVIKTSVKRNNQLAIYINKQKKYAAKQTVSGNNKAFEIVDIYSENNSSQAPVFYSSRVKKEKLEE